MMASVNTCNRIFHRAVAASGLFFAELVRFFAGLFSFAYFYYYYYYKKFAPPKQTLQPC